MRIKTKAVSFKFHPHTVDQINAAVSNPDIKPNKKTKLIESALLIAYGITTPSKPPKLK